MKINLNDFSYEVAIGTKLDKFIESLGIQVQGKAIAIDYEVVPKSKWHEMILEDGMALLMIQAVSGG